MVSVNNPAIMNLRDFVEEVGVDPSRPGMSSALQLKTSLNIPPLQAEEHCDDIDISPVPTLIRLFCPAGQLHSFQQEVFIYAWGQFHVVCGSDETQIVIYAYSVDWLVYGLYYVRTVFSNITKCQPSRGLQRY